MIKIKDIRLQLHISHAKRKMRKIIKGKKEKIALIIWRIIWGYRVTEILLILEEKFVEKNCEKKL